MNMQEAAICPSMHCKQFSYVMILSTAHALLLLAPDTSDHFFAYCLVHAFAVLINSFLFSLYSLAIPPSTASSG